MIHEILKQGKENAITAARIASTLNLPMKEVSKRVKIERRAGQAICSCQNGYYLAANDDEIRDICGRLRHRAGEIFATRRALLKHLPTPENPKKEDPGKKK
ncbi:MAG: hypothetical protein J5601_03750 [Elusimicrobiaceae bacterium]|nr:hypothetical protein [Elusimicrobiaceae bacterium]